MATDLVAFLRARLDEDEGYLNSNRRHLWTQRPLREVEAKRAILAEHQHEKTYLPTDGEGFGCSCCCWDRDEGQGGCGWCATVRALAAVYRDHPDYDPEWNTATGTKRKD